MKPSKLMINTSVVLLSALILGACSNNEPANNAEPTTAATATSSAIEATAAPEPSATPEVTEEQATASPAGNEPQASERPLTQDFGGQEGGVPGQKGTLAQGEGYSLYIFEGFTLDAKSGKLSLTEDPAYYAEIEPLPAGYDLAALKKQGQTELSATGEAKDFSGELIEHPLGYAELYLQAGGSEGFEDYMVWKNQAGDAYLFRIHNPKSELSSKFSPWLLVSLATLEAK